MYQYNIERELVQSRWQQLYVVVNTHRTIHKIVEVFHEYLFEHIQVGDHDIWLLSNIEPFRVTRFPC